MSRLGIFVDRRTLSRAEQLHALIRCRDVAESRGHSTDFIFPVDMHRIHNMDGLFIRARTDPMNATYVAARIADLHGIPVIDDPDSIRICSDKINMYSHLVRGKVRIPRTEVLSRKEITQNRLESYFEALGTPLVIKEPSTSFSMRVERVFDLPSFLSVARRFFRMSDRIIVQEYIGSEYDWRIGVLAGEPVFACKYIIPPLTFKIQASVNGHIVYCSVESVRMEEVPDHVVKEAVSAAAAIGNGLYGVDVKDREGQAWVIEVNDNPSLDGGEDDLYSDIYGQIISSLLGV